MNLSVQEIKPPQQVNWQVFTHAFDGKISKHLDQYPWLLNRNQFTIIQGSPGSGKSTYVENLFSKKTKLFHKQFHDIYYYIPIHSYHKDATVFSQLPKEKIRHNMTVFELEGMIQEIEEELDDKDITYTALIMDDCANMYKDNSIQTALTKLIYNRRHLHLSIFMITQSLQKIPKQLRQACDQVVLFKPSNTCRDIILEEFNQYYEKEQFEALMKYIFDEKFNFMTFRPFSNQIFKNQNLLEVRVKEEQNNILKDKQEQQNASEKKPSGTGNRGTTKKGNDNKTKKEADDTRPSTETTRPA